MSDRLVGSAPVTAARQHARAVAGQAWRSVAAELDRQGPRAFAWLVVAFAAGVVLFFTWNTDPHPLLGAMAAVLALVLIGAARQRRALRAMAWALMAFGAGHAAAEIRTGMVATPVLTRTMSAQEIQGRVVDAEFRPTSHRIVLDELTVANLAPEDTPVRVRVTIPVRNGLPKVGDRIVVRAVLRPPMWPAVPDGFAFQRQLYFARIGATGFTAGAWTVTDVDPDSLESVRRRIAERVRIAIADPGDAAVTAALIMGEQSAIPEELQDAYRKSGLAHLLSISGVHMSLLAAAVFFLVRRGLALMPFLALRVDAKKIAAWTALGATGLYLLISGLSVPAVRSFLMIGVVLVAILLDRTALSLRTLAWAALVLMAIYPDAVIGASFQMSFMAVLALIALAEHARLHVRWRGVHGEFQIWRAIGLIFVGLVVTDIAAGGATALYAIYHFNRFPTYSMAANFLAGPITGLWVMPWGLVAMLLMPFGLDGVPFALMGEGVGFVNGIARTVAAWPGAQVHVPPMSAAALALGSFGLLVLCLWQGRLRWAGVAMIALGVGQAWVAKQPDVLMDGTGTVVAISDSHGHIVLRPGRGESFTREVWQDRYGASTAEWTQQGDSGSGLRCDSDGCILTRDSRRALLAFNATALAQDCASVDAAISFVPARAFCRGTPNADLFDVRQRGAVALRMTDDGVTLRYALDGVGDRPWSRRARRPQPATTEPAASTSGEDPPASPEP